MSAAPPSRSRLMTLGLLSKYPMRSKTLQRFVARRGPHYTTAQKAQMVALYWTPELPRNWTRFQFEQLGMNGEDAMRSLRMYAYDPDLRARYSHLGQENLLHIGQPEVQRFYDRRDKSKKRCWHPTWAMPIMNDHLKQGMTTTAIARKYDVDRFGLMRAMKRGIFTPHGLGPGNTHWPPHYVKGK